MKEEITFVLTRREEKGKEEKSKEGIKIRDKQEREDKRWKLKGWKEKSDGREKRREWDKIEKWAR